MGLFKKSLYVALIAISLDSCGRDYVSKHEVEDSQCEIHGDANPTRKEYRLNAYKNRYNLPSTSDFMQGISIENLISSSSEDDYSLDKAVEITGYVFKVKMGGIETCNCRNEDEQFRDTHIELTPDAEHTDAKYRIIVEVSPRIRAIMAAKGIDWTTDELKRSLVGHKISAQGWLFYDSEHMGQACATHPNGQRNWRASCWEVHPVTSIKILD